MQLALGTGEYERMQVAKMPRAAEQKQDAPGAWMGGRSLPQTSLSMMYFIKFC